MIRERERSAASGLLMLLVWLAVIVGAGYGFVRALRQGEVALAVGLLVADVVAVVCITGFFMVNPNEGRVLQLFGDYRGTVKDAGLRWANPFYTKKAISLR